MPYLPELNESAQTTLMTSTFLGYNHNLVTQDGEMYNMTNLSGMNYPLLSPRKRRGVLQTIAHPAGMIAKDSLAIVDGDRLIYNGNHVPGVVLSTDEDMLPKRMVSMGAYLCIWPDKVYVNTADLSDYGTMYANWESVAETNLTMCREDGTDYDTTQIAVSNTAPSAPANGSFWLDTSGKPHVLKQYSAYTEEWVQVATTYVKIHSVGIGAQFSAYDTVRISGLAFPAEEDPELHEQVEALNADMIIYACGDDYIVVAGLIDQAVTLSDTVKAQRRVPDCDYITEANNRLWGCKYGLVDGEPVNEIYACKLGDFKNWYSYMGLSTDSYAVSVGTDGVFTGAATLKGTPLFWKEGCVHRITGYTPSTFTMTTTMCRGVQDGSADSIAVVGEALMYKGRTDVMLYDGSQPVSISNALGDVRYHNASAGAYADRYYISMQEQDGPWHFFVYDVQKGIWHREDGMHAVHFAQMDDELYFINADTGELVAANGYDGTPEAELPWEAVFGKYGYDYEGQKYLSRYNLRMSLEPGSRVKMEIQYDSDGKWHTMGTMTGKTLRTFMVPVIPRRCDHCQLRLSGTGGMKLYSIARVLELGGDG